MPDPHPLGLAVLEVMTDAYIAFDRDLTYRYVNRRAADLLGHDADALVGRSMLDVFPEQDGGRFHRTFEEALAERAPRHMEEHVERVDRWLETRIFPADDGVAVFIQDISERKRAERELRRRERRYSVLAHAFASAVWETGPDGRPIGSRTWSELTGRTGGRPDPQWAEVVHEDDRERAQTAWETAVRTGAEYDETYRMRRADGTWRHVRARGVPVREDGEIVQWIGVIEDVTERLAAEEALRRAALEDPLTGLANRTHFVDRLAHVLRRRERGQAAVLYVDLDRFKAVNDAEGHEAGDLLLRTVAARLREGVRPSDVVSRLSGDEFAVLLDGLDEPDEAVVIAHRLAASVGEPVRGTRTQVTVAVGVAVVGEGDTDPEAVLSAADAAMYAVKARGGDGVEVHGAALRERLRRRMWIESELRAGLDRDGLQLHYQPVVDLGDDGPGAAAEALLRWRARDGTVLPAAETIAVAERTGLIVPIGRAVLRAACVEAARWNAGGGRPTGVGVNVSARQFARRGELVDEVRAALDESGLDPSLLRLEITESVLVESTARDGSVLDRLRALGVRLVIDDFGVGYSSLSYLHRLPVDAVKIDRAFVARLPGDAGSARIVEAVVGVARAFGVRVVAEGIERPEQLDAVRALGCDAAQGYLLARPVPASEAPGAVQDALRAVSA